jgi:hypothetical protein
MKKIQILILLALLQQAAHAQNVGIGTANPTRAKLEVHGAVGGTAAIFGGESTGISIQRNWPGIGFNQYYDVNSRYLSTGFAAVQYVDFNSGAFAFDVFDNGSANNIANGQRRVLTLTPSGNMIIGPYSHNSSLSVSKPSGSQATAFLFGTNHHSTFNFSSIESTYIRAGKDNGTVFINDIPGGKIVMSGSVGINTSTPGFPLEIRQTAPPYPKGIVLVEPVNFNRWSYVIGAGGSSSLYLSHNETGKGYFYKVDGSYYAYSDRRLKTNILPLSPTLEKVQQLQPVSYEMLHNNAGHTRTIGFIAQDVKKLFPQLVSIVPNAVTTYKDLKDLHSLSYSGLNVIAIKAIQEQQSIIVNQTVTLKALEAEYQQLNERVDAMISKQKK